MRFPYRGAGIGLVSNGCILMGIRSKKPFMGKWSIPGGGKEKGEAYLQNAKREFLEETGCNLNDLDCEFIGSWTLSLPPFFRWTTFFFKTDSTDFSFVPSEFNALEWIPLGKAKELACRPFTRMEMHRLRTLL